MTDRAALVEKMTKAANDAAYNYEEYCSEIMMAAALAAYEQHMPEIAALKAEIRTLRNAIANEEMVIPEMIEAGVHHLYEFTHERGNEEKVVADIYRAMLAAATAKKEPQT